MKMLTLGRTDIVTPQNAFGALPVQRVGMDEAVKLLRRAHEGGMTFFDTARAYTDSEEKLGEAFSDIRERDLHRHQDHGVDHAGGLLARQLETSLKKLRTPTTSTSISSTGARQCYRPGDGTGMYECMLEAKRQGKIRHIGITNHVLCRGAGGHRLRPVRDAAVPLQLPLLARRS